MSKLIQHLTTVQGRIITGFAFAVAITVGLWPDHARSIDPVELGAVVTTGLAWLFAEIAGHRAASPHDIKLFETITTKLPQRLLDFLREHDFGASFGDPGIAGLFDVSGWEGSRYDFLDKKLQKQWVGVRLSIRQFGNDFALNTFPANVAGNWFTVHPTIGDPENPENFIQERIDRLNTSASRLVVEIDAFERSARKRLSL